MALNVISNYAANVAHRNLAMNDRLATDSLSKLSSGSRVVSAKDDAASLAIGSRLTAEIAAQKQAQVNATQASSMLQIADGAMSKVSDILIRMKSLAVQAGSGQLSSTERGFLDTEYQALLSEVDRIANDTEFNGTLLVDGQSTTTFNENGLGTNSAVETSDGIASVSFDNDVGDAAFKLSYDSSTNILTLTNVNDDTSQGIDIGSNAITDTQTVRFEDAGVSVSLNSSFDKGTDITTSNSFTLGGGGTGAISNVELSGIDSSTAVQALSSNVITVDTSTASATKFSIGNFSGTADIDATANGVSVTLSDGSGADFTLTFDVGTAFDDHATTSSISLGDLGALVYGNTTTNNTSSFTFKLGTGSTAGVDDVTFTINAVSADALSIDGGDITTVANANTASDAISAAIDTLNTARASIGAAQNRLQFAADNLATTIENSESARSSLMDLDVASEMTNFTSKQILIQVGVSMLAQANQMPQNLLQLFR